MSADDDIFYPSFWLERLYSAYVRAPQYIHAHRAHKVTFLHTGEIAAYENWEFCVENVPPSFRNFATGVGGVLYPPHSLHECVLDSSLFTRLAPSADDVWFWACALLKGTKINVIDNNHSHLEIIEPSSQDSALWQVNWLQNQNNIQIKNVLNHYPQLLALLAKQG